MSSGTKDKDEHCEEYAREEVEEKTARGLAQLKNGGGVDGEEFFEK